MKPGALFGVYDVMQSSGADLTFPVPWSTEPGTSFVASPDQYKHALTGAGFTIEAERNRRDFAAAFFAAIKAQGEVQGGPPPLALHVTLGDNAALKVRNMVDNIAAGIVAPCEIIARKPG